MVSSPAIPIPQISQYGAFCRILGLLWDREWKDCKVGISHTLHSSWEDGGEPREKSEQNSYLLLGRPISRLMSSENGIRDDQQ